MIYEEEYHHFNHIIEKAVLDHCTDSLERIHLMNAGRFSMFEIDKPFRNLSHVEMSNGTICSPFSNIAEWFPALQSLKLTNLQLHSTPAEKIFDHRLCTELEKLEIRNLKSKNGGNVYMEKIAVLVQHSPNLSYIWIDNQDNVDELLGAIAELNPMLSNLYLNQFLGKPVGTATIHFKSLKQLDFNSTEQTLNIAADEIEHLYIDSDGERFDEIWWKGHGPMPNGKPMKLNRSSSHGENNAPIAENWNHDTICGKSDQRFSFLLRHIEQNLFPSKRNQR